MVEDKGGVKTLVGLTRERGRADLEDGMSESSLSLHEVRDGLSTGSLSDVIMSQFG